MRNWVLFFLLFSCFIGRSQNFNSLIPYDTLKYTSRIGGQLDSIDVFNAFLSSTNPSGSISELNTFTPRWLFTNHGAQIQQNFNSWKPLVFSGLPHIGFNYSFGSQGTQNVLMSYQQSFGKQLIVNLEYKKNKGSGFLRNGDYNLNDLEFQLAKKGSFYSFLTQASYLTSEFHVNNGLLVDSLADDFALRLLPVQKENAYHSNQRTNLIHTNYFDFSKDSLVAIGLFTSHQLQIRNLRYSEEIDTLSLIYNEINFDSTLTMDQNQLSSITNGAGLFLKNKKVAFGVGAEVRYWKYDNLNHRNDTTEVNLAANFQYQTRKFKFSEVHKHNLIGAKQEFKNELATSILVGRSKLNASLNYSSELPEVHQRFIYANNYASTIQNPQKQTRLYSEIAFQHSFGGIDLNAGVSYVSLKNNYFFIDSLWRNDTITNLSALQFNLRASYRFKKLYLQPSYAFAINSSSIQFIPNHQINVRTFLKGGLFKAKKMQAYIGVDASYLSQFSPIQFNSLIGSYEFWKTSSVNSGYFNLHFFTGFQIDEFKFYVRFENIGYFWNQHSMPVLTNHPIPGTQFRLGLTWDFFN